MIGVKFLIIIQCKQVKSYPQSPHNYHSNNLRADPNLDWEIESMEDASE